MTGLETVAFIDDDPDVRAATTQALRIAGLAPLAFASAGDALAAIGADFAGVVVTDVRMPQIDGLELHRRLAALDPDLPVILITGHGDVEDAVRAIKSGAYDFITKPFAADRLILSVRRALGYRALVLENRLLSAAAAAPGPDIPILGDAPAMVALRATLRQLAGTDASVLIEGEPGVGKEHAARILHRMSRRRRSFSIVECGVTPDTLIAEDLFGHGARLAGQKPRVGRVEAADGGTLFLHDIDRASPALQAALARVLEERAYPLADVNDVRPVAFRAIGAASQDLSALMKAGAFRADLFYGLAMVRLQIPPLRERRADIPLLFAAFQADAARRLQRVAPPLTDAVRRRLIDHDWPGNIRELQHFAEQVVLGFDAAPSPRSDPDGMTLPQRVNRFEAGVIRDALAAAKGDVRTALAALGIPRKTFYDKLARHGIDIDAFRPGRGGG